MPFDATPMSARVCCVLGAYFLFPSCSSPNATTPISPFSIDAAATLDEGDSAQLRLTPAAGTSSSARWTSSDPEIADVSSTGAVLARGPGRATIVASVGGQSAQTEVIVRRAPLPDLYVVAHRGFAGVFPE